MRRHLPSRLILLLLAADAALGKGPGGKERGGNKRRLHSGETCDEQGPACEAPLDCICNDSTATRCVCGDGKGAGLADVPDATLTRRRRRRRLHSGEICDAMGPACGDGLECVCTSGRRLLGAPTHGHHHSGGGSSGSSGGSSGGSSAGYHSSGTSSGGPLCYCEYDSPPPPAIPAPPMPPPPELPLPPAPPPLGCSHAAIVLVNNNDKRQYNNAFWTDDTSEIGSGPNIGCGSTWNEDKRYSAYWTMPIGTEVMLVARGSGGTLLGKAVYPVLTAHQGSTLFQLLTGTHQTTFTGPKDATKSAGGLWNAGHLRTGDGHGGGAGSNAQCLGDLFMDHDDALIANANSGYNSHTTQIRLATNFITTQGPCGSNGHWYGGIGGYHHHSGWTSNYESAPSYPYCNSYNAYGNSGNDDAPCLYGQRTHVDFAIYVDAAAAVNAIQGHLGG